MTEHHDALKRMQYELMLISRYQLRPSHKDEPTMDRSAYVLLSRLELATPMTIKELAHALRLDISTVHRQLGALLRTGHVAYVAGVAGEVARRIAPTPAGRAALIDTRASYEDGLNSVVADWPEERQRQFTALLREFNQGVETMEDAPWPRPGD